MRLGEDAPPARCAATAGGGAAHSCTDSAGGRHTISRSGARLSCAASVARAISLGRLAAAVGGTEAPAGWRGSPLSQRSPTSPDPAAWQCRPPCQTAHREQAGGGMVGCTQLRDRRRGFAAGTGLNAGRSARIDLAPVEPGSRTGRAASGACRAGSSAGRRATATHEHRIQQAPTSPTQPR